MSLFVGLRFGNKDYFNYVLFFEKTPNIIDFFPMMFSGEFIGIVEPGFYLFNSIVKIFTNNLETYFFILCFISLTLMFHSFSKLDKNYLIIFLLGVSSIYIGTYFTQVRQGLAIGISSIAIMHLVYYRYSKFWFFAIIGFFIHTSVLAIFILPLFRKLKFNNYLLLLLVPIALFVNILHLDIVLVDVIANIMGDGHLVEKINLFFFSNRENRTISILSGINIVTSFLIILLFLLKPYISQKVKWLDFLIWTLLIGLFYYNIFSSAGEVAGRMYREVTILLPFAIYYIYKTLGFKKVFYNYLLLVLVFIFFLYYGHASEGFHNYESRMF
jgi:hypothetical protein